MTQFVAFLRAINVGGHNVSMDRLRPELEAMGLDDVRTFIASGNVLFTSRARAVPALEARIEKQLEEALGYDVATFVRTGADVARIADHDAFPDAPDGDLVQVAFLKTKATAAVRRALAELEGPKDRFDVRGAELFWHVRGRTMDSQVKPKALRDALGGPTTVRNVNTVRRIAAALAE